MATCKDCVSYDICQNNKKIKIEIYDNGFLKQPRLCEYVQQICKTFKNKADFVEVKHGVVIPQWISVKDRLPEDKQNILTIDSESKMEVCFYEKEWKGVFQQCGGLVKIFNITHWMPLPEPPKKEGTDNG